MNTELIDKAIDERKGIWGGKPGNDYLYKLSHKVNSFSYDSRRLEYRGQDFICTRAEFEARVAERQGKPSWGDAPEWANWRGQDYRGWWAWMEHEPARTVNGSYDLTDAVWAESGKGEVIIPWQDTLEKRTEVDVQPIPIKDHPLADEIKNKIESGDMVANGAAGDEYVPKVGEKCEVLNNLFHNSDWESCEPLFVGNETIVYESESCTERMAHLGTCTFRPVKSDKEKFVQYAMEINNRMIDADMNDTSLIFGAVFEELVDKPS